MVQTPTHARPFHPARIVLSPLAAALHSAAQQVAVEVSSTPTTPTPTAPIVTPPLSSPLSLRPSACLPRHHGFSFGSAFPAWLALPLRPGAVSYSVALCPCPVAKVKPLYCASGRSLPATVVAVGLTSWIGAAHRGSSWNWPCWRKQRPRPSRSCHGSTCDGTLGVVHVCVEPTKCFAGRCRARCLVLLSRTMLTSNAHQDFSLARGQEISQSLADPPHTYRPQTAHGRPAGTGHRVRIERSRPSLQWPRHCAATAS
jgi:hypothetical protein